MHTIDDSGRGLYRKFRVERMDGRSAPGEKQDAEWQKPAVAQPDAFGWDASVEQIHRELAGEVPPPSLGKMDAEEFAEACKKHGGVPGLEKP